ncbi:uncharacterized protein LOC107463341 [Arachis duranensis]|uniref:Uncharacterized protein LOC107463341 n=1 Tax=Arachis duranensis TaxID=130453 RepID=A0A6P4BH11_ARADU|nr:uncharacterized protein LOC107463341 [Arachis duranensis]
MAMIADILVAADTVAVTAAKGLCVLRSCNSTCNVSVTDSLADQISTILQPYDAVAPPPVKPRSYRMPRRTLLRNKRRTKRKLSGDGAGDNENEGFFFGDGGDGVFGGGGGGGFGGSGGRWNFNRFGDGHNDWDEHSSSIPDPAFDFVYQVLSWIMLSNCIHFAFKRIVQILSDGAIVDSGDREKVPARLTPIC